MFFLAAFQLIGTSIYEKILLNSNYPNVHIGFKMNRSNSQPGFRLGYILQYSVEMAFLEPEFFVG